MTFTISDLRERPEFFDTVVDRIWRQWWQNRVSRETFADRVRENLAGPGMPLALVAHRGEVFLGTASLIAADLDERPQFTPWIAAVWTDPNARGQGVAAALIEAACAEGFTFGYDRIYLCARPPMRGFYTGLGWTPIEDHVGAHDLSVFVRHDAPTLDAARAP